MAWIESHQSLSRHRKTLKALRGLSVDRHKLIGHLMQLWWWGLDSVPANGFMGDISNGEIAYAAEWDGNEDDFVDALIHAGFIDEKEDGRWLHDWYEYAGKLLVKREKDAERKRKSGGVPSEIHRISTGSSVDIQWSSERTQPNPTVPNRTNTERELAVQQIAKAYAETFGPLRGEPNQLMTLLDYMDKGMELELIITAIHKSSNADSPLKYADGILAKQLRKGITTVAEAIAAGGERSEYPRRSGTSTGDGPPARKRIIDTPGAY